MATGSYANPIVIDCDEARGAPCAGRPCRNYPAFDSSILRERQKEPVYRLGDLFSRTKYGIEGQQVLKRGRQRQHSRPGPGGAHRGGISAKPPAFEELARNKITKSARRKLARFRSFSEKSCCICTEDEGCAESCQNREMCYDCDETNCRIGPRCTNRLVNKAGAQCKVLRAGDRGFGLFADERIHHAQFVAQYTGEVITMVECRERYRARYNGRQVHYVMRMGVLDLACDATRIGSRARFLNHHCDPNCVVQKWTVSGVPCLFIFAKRDVEAGEELTLDYNFVTFSGAEGQPCLCGAEKCRGSLGVSKRSVINMAVASRLGQEARQQS